MMYGHLAFATRSNTEGCVRCKHLHVALSRVLPRYQILCSSIFEGNAPANVTEEILI